jgi:hypothetical protein
MLGFGTYDQARSTGLDEYRKAPDDQQYLQVDVQKERNAGIEPTPYMDKMPEGARFYQKIDQVSTEIVSSRQMIEKCSGAMKEVASLPQAAEKNLQDAEVLFNNGKYADAEKLAADTIASLATATATTTTTTSTSMDIGTQALGFAFLLMPVIVIVLAVLYVRARRRRTVAPQAGAPTIPAAPPIRYCVQCGKEISLNKNFCKYCGATQQP